MIREISTLSTVQALVDDGPPAIIQALIWCFDKNL